MKSQYNYPDPNDAITMRVINENQVNENYWSSSEKWILKNIHQTIENGGVSNYSLLDAGCGEGRLFTEFINYTSKIIGIEPDKQRYENALRCVRENHLENKVQVINASLENTHLQDKFDVVLSSHIIQHISTDHVETHLTKLAQATKDNGFLIINTNVSNRKDEYFIKGLIEEDAVKEPEITQKEFNELTSKTGQLPVHMFNRDKVCEYMLSIGFDLVDMKVFHVEKEAQNLYQDNTDQTVNDEPDLFRKYGRDICFIFRKRIHMQIIEEGALAEFCAFNIKLYGLKLHELSDRLKNFQLENSKIFDTQKFCCSTNNNISQKIEKHECICAKTADNFCRTGQMIYNSYRFFIGTTYFNFKGHLLPLKISVTLFPYRNIGIICLNVIIKNLSVDQVIALKQFFCNTGNDKIFHEWRIGNNTNETRNYSDEKDLRNFFTPHSNTPVTDLKQIRGDLFWFVCNNLINDMTEVLNKDARSNFSLLSMNEYWLYENDRLEVIIDHFKRLYSSKFIYPTLEIKKTNFNFHNDDAQEWATNNSLALYGLLVGDEGYKFIPNSLATKRISEYHWSTRKFVNIFAYSFNIIMINFKTSSNIGTAYMERQRKWSKEYYSNDRNTYFVMSPCIAGIDHGLFRSIERNIVVYFENEYISRVDQSSAIDINKKRNKILLFIYKTATALDEINELFSVISHASGTADSIESIKQRLTLRSEEKNLINQAQNNIIILILTIVSTLLGLLAITEKTNAYHYLKEIMSIELKEHHLWAGLTQIIILFIIVMCVWQWKYLRKKIRIYKYDIFKLYTQWNVLQIVLIIANQLVNILSRRVFDDIINNK